ncbi:MAG TPA: FIST C-terminal domain-containing protein [Myxococcales bacterium LLY-WYZ-16_1]|nr:FIST C-terminal domain-containing protein [Myxococcales bacterium LLY-WYZ-16_1]
MWVDALSEQTWLEDAADAAIEKIRAHCPQAPDVVFAFWTHDGPAAPLVARLSRAFPEATRVGAKARGVLAEGREVEGTPALALLVGSLETNFAAVPAVQAAHLPPAPSLDEAVEQARKMTGWIGPASTLVVLAEPHSTPVEPLLRALDLAAPDAVKVGGLASGALAADRPSLLLQDRLLTEGAVVLSLGRQPAETVVAQGCRPIGEPSVVLRHRGPVIEELSHGRPGAVLAELYASLPASDQALFRHSLFAGIEMKDQRAYGPGDFLIRNILGVDPSTQHMVVGADVRQFQALQFHLRDREAARSELTDAMSRLRRLRATTPAAGLLFTCLGRGRGLYGTPNAESEMVRTLAPELPLAGFFCNGEIGPIGGQTFLHGYTATGAFFYSDEGT